MSTSIDEMLLQRPATSLEAIRDVDDLQERYESKYVVTADTAAEVIGALDLGWRVLEVAGRRSTAYRSSYFDDENFGLFRDHVKGRRLRYKVRTRQYENDPDEMLEIKLKSGRGATDKRRVARTGSFGTELTATERRWLSDMVFDAYGRRLESRLAFALGLGYTRRTMFNPAIGERLTIDTDLVAQAEGASAAPVGEAVVIEVKGVDWYGPTVRLLQRRSVRALTFSKYCAALASLHPDLDQRARHRAQRSFERYS